jgi:hypothetical protein
LFGAERREALAVSFTRLSHEPIDQRGYIERPILVVVMGDAQAQALQTIDEKIGANTEDVRANTKKTNSLPRQAAVTLAEAPA